MKGYVFVLTLALTLTLLQYSDGCSCMPSHLQSQYCRSDFVILARVKREKHLNHIKAYKVRVRKPYKMSEKALVALKSGRLLTPNDEAMCGVNLEVNKLYAISGFVDSLRARINLCGMIVQWKDLTQRQRKGLKALYKHGCSCKIDDCKFRRCAKTPDNCLMTSECHLKEGICLRQHSKKCMWTRNLALATCLKPNSPFLDDLDKKSDR